jgi:hypothetical protein
MTPCHLPRVWTVIGDATVYAWLSFRWRADTPGRRTAILCRVALVED